VKFLRAALGVIVWLVAVSAGVLAVEWSPLCAKDSAYSAWLLAWRIPLGGAALLAAALWPVSLLARRRGGEYLSYRNGDGDVRIRLGAVRDYLSRLEDTEKDVHAVRPTVSIDNGRLTVDLSCSVSAGRPVGELCHVFQSRAIAALKIGLGIEKIGRIRVTVREFDGAPPADLPVEQAPGPDAEPPASEDEPGDDEDRARPASLSVSDDPRSA